MKILLVDDSKTMRNIQRSVLTQLGHTQIEEACDGQEAWRMFSQRSAEIGMVVTDQKMPGLTGLELLRFVARTEPRVVRILSTAYTETDLVTAAMREGLIDYFISKPWELDRVAAVLRQGVEHGEHSRRGT